MQTTPFTGKIRNQGFLGYIWAGYEKPKPKLNTKSSIKYKHGKKTVQVNPRITIRTTMKFLKSI